MTVPSLADIEKRLKDYAPAAANGDDRLNPGLRKKEGALRDAAVLILLVPQDDGSYSVLFTERTKTLHAHAGQISFPGGGVEEGDADDKATALREASEEIGLDPANARVLGALEDYVTRTGFRVRPVVAVLETRQDWTPNPDEVAKIFEVPLDYLLKPGSLQEESLVFEGGERRFYALNYGGNHIWGATAGMLHSFADAVADPPANTNTPLSRRKTDAPRTK
jgi:8-oxo-dGTP pyrophosphatase MutT (NUDIX family)